MIHVVVSDLPSLDGGRAGWGVARLLDLAFAPFGLLGGFLEMGLVFRQTLLDASAVASQVHIVKILQVTEIIVL